MKKKMIERIPYLQLAKVSRKKEVEYIAVTAIQEIDGEDHLIAEVYRNKKECREIPVARIVITNKDFGTFITGSGTWSRGRITRNEWSSSNLIWREDRKWKAKWELEKENILQSDGDRARITGFLPDRYDREDLAWWKYIDQKQEEITRAEREVRSARQAERRRSALKERKENTPELPEKKILEYADRVLFNNEHYLYYKKHGVRAAIACAKCGGVDEVRWKAGQSYESQFECKIEEPRAGQYGTCPMCGCRGRYIPKGKAKSFYREKGYIFLGQKYKKDGVVLRYITVEKEWMLGEICSENGTEMYNAEERMSGVESARIYLEPGKKIQKDHHKNNPYDGKDFWDDCNLYGLANIQIKEGAIMPETYTNMGGTFLQYSAIEEYQKTAGKMINPADYLERYMQTPQIEILVKMGLVRIVEELVRCHYGIVNNINARKPSEFLGIRNEQVKLLRKHKGDTAILRVMQIEKRSGQVWTDEQVEHLAELGLGEQVDIALEYMGIQQLLNRVEKYAGCEYGTMCSTAAGRLKQTAVEYIDYLNMRKEQGYDLNNAVYQAPRDLKGAHAKMVMEINKKAEDERVQEVNTRFPMIRKNYRRLRDRFYFEDEGLLIRPARNAGEIVMEGRTLHHCVGGDSYLKKHDDGTNIILFLRDVADQETPYITVEIEAGSLHIQQWYGAYDKKPDKERIEKWLEKYDTRLRCAGAVAGEETGMQQEIRIYA